MPEQLPRRVPEGGGGRQPRQPPPQRPPRSFAWEAGPGRLPRTHVAQQRNGCAGRHPCCSAAPTPRTRTGVRFKGAPLVRVRGHPVVRT
ncbi:hypothetical protein L838_4903 [Mycobacterium avium MAV_120709_2344]|nr:hypothetical protein L838_4903 [Mycobacterium avium MAV_120709_2344]